MIEDAVLHHENYFYNGYIFCVHFEAPDGLNYSFYYYFEKNTFPINDKLKKGSIMLGLEEIELFNNKPDDTFAQGVWEFNNGCCIVTISGDGVKDMNEFPDITVKTWDEIIEMYESIPDFPDAYWDKFVIENNSFKK